jgi:DNA-binding NarL/FixJ family response regulator
MGRANFDIFLKYALVITENPGLRNELQLKLGALDIEVSKHATASTAFEEMSKMRIRVDLVICEMKTGDWSAHKFMTQVRTNPRFDKTIFILIAGKEELRTIEEMRPLRPNGIMIKPFSTDHMLQHIDATFYYFEQFNKKMDVMADIYQARLNELQQAYPNAIKLYENVAAYKEVGLILFELGKCYRYKEMHGECQYAMNKAMTLDNSLVLPVTNFLRDHPIDKKKIGAVKEKPSLPLRAIEAFGTRSTDVARSPYGMDRIKNIIVTTKDAETQTALRNLAAAYGKKNILPLSNIAEILDTSASHDINLIITDFNLRDGTALKLADTIGNISPAGMIPTVLLLSKSEEDSILEALQLGIAGFCRRPYAAGDLIHAIDQLYIHNDLSRLSGAAAKNLCAAWHFYLEDALALADDACTFAESLNAGDVMVKLTRGLILDSQRERERAEEIFQAVIKQNPDLEIIIKRTKARVSDQIKAEEEKKKEQERIERQLQNEKRISEEKLEKSARRSSEESGEEEGAVTPDEDERPLTMEQTDEEDLFITKDDERPLTEKTDDEENLIMGEDEEQRWSEDAATDEPGILRESDDENLVFSDDAQQDDRSPVIEDDGDLFDERQAPVIAVESPTSQDYEAEIFRADGANDERIPILAADEPEIRIAPAKSRETAPEGSDFPMQEPKRNQEREAELLPFRNKTQAPDLIEKGEFEDERTALLAMNQAEDDAAPRDEADEWQKVQNAGSGLDSSELGYRFTVEKTEKKEFVFTYTPVRENEDTREDSLKAAIVDWVRPSSFDTDKNDLDYKFETVKKLAEQAQLFNGRMMASKEAKFETEEMKEYIRVVGSSFAALDENAFATAPDTSLAKKMAKLQQALQKKPDNAKLQYELGSLATESGLVADLLQRAASMKAPDDIAPPHHRLGGILGATLNEIGGSASTGPKLGKEFTSNLLDAALTLDGGRVFLATQLAAEGPGGIIRMIDDEAVANGFFSDLRQKHLERMLLSQLKDNPKALSHLKSLLPEQVNLDVFIKGETAMQENIFDIIKSQGATRGFLSMLDQFDMASPLFEALGTGSATPLNFIEVIKNSPAHQAKLRESADPLALMAEMIKRGAGTAMLEDLFNQGGVKFVEDVIRSGGGVRMLDQVIKSPFADLVLQRLCKDQNIHPFFAKVIKNDIAMDMVRGYLGMPSLEPEELLDMSIDKQRKLVDRILEDGASSKFMMAMLRGDSKNAEELARDFLLAADTRHILFDALTTEASEARKAYDTERRNAAALINLADPLQKLHETMWNGKEKAGTDLASIINTYKQHRNEKILYEALHENLQQDHYSLQLFKKTFRELCKQGFHQEAGQFFNKHYKIYTEHDGMRESLYEFLKGFDKDAASKADLAARVLEEGHDKHANDYYYLKELAATALKAGKYREMRKWVYKMLRLNRRNGEAYNLLAISFKKQGNLKKAIREYQRGIKVDPNNSKLHHNLAIALANLGDDKRSIEIYRKSKKLGGVDKKAS